MTARTFKPTGVCTLALLVTLAECAPAADTNETLAAADPAAAMYISNKPVSTDCGVVADNPGKLDINVIDLNRDSNRGPSGGIGNY